VVVIDEQGNLCSQRLSPFGIDYKTVAKESLEQLWPVKVWKASRLFPPVTAAQFSFAIQAKRNCLPRQRAYFYVPRAVNVVDIGGQDNRSSGSMPGTHDRFQDDRKCAAGTALSSRNCHQNRDSAG